MAFLLIFLAKIKRTYQLIEEDALFYFQIGVRAIFLVLPHKNVSGLIIF